jgi:heme-degrading monooxygenase HmoA
MTYSIIRLSTPDYARWRTTFDASAAARKAFGETGNSQIFRDRDNPNTVTAIVEWSDAKRAKEWFESPQLKEAQQKTGVTVLENHVLDRA